MATEQAKSIVISGYFGFANGGDEAVLAAIVQLIRSKLPKARIVALSATPEATAAAYGIESINRKSMSDLKKALKSAKLFISGGGSLFQDATSIRSVYYYAKTVQLAHKAGVPAIVLAQGLGPLSSGLGKSMTKKALAPCEFFSWRDEEALNLAVEIGLPRTKMALTCDPVLLWHPELASAKSENTNSPKTAKRIGFALRPWKDFKLQELVRDIFSLSKAGYQVVFLPFQDKVDTKLGEILQNDFKLPIEVIPYEGPQRLYEEISKLDYLIGMRLHSLIMAEATQVAAGAISYDPKVDSFAKLAKIPVLSNADNIWGGAIFKAVEDEVLSNPVDRRAEYEALWEKPLAVITEIYNR